MGSFCSRRRACSQRCEQCQQRWALCARHRAGHHHHWCAACIVDYWNWQDDARAYQRHLLKEYYETGYWPGHGESGDDDVQINEEPQMNRIDEDSQEENGDDEAQNETSQT